MDKKLPVTLITDGVKVCGDTEENVVNMVIVQFKDGNQLTYYLDEANRFMLHYCNGLQLKDVSEVPLPKALEWEKVKRLQ